jgi:hypothetical protein
MNFHPEAVTGNDGLSLHRRSTHSYLVAREDQEHYLKQEGYVSVHSVGLPIIYQRPQEVERLPGSLLVMPTHSLDYTTHDWNFEQYAREIHSIRNRFSSVVACVSPSCFRRGYWVEAFQERGIPLISGADYFDANSYQRLVRLFGRFDFMTTNGFGSHIAYAAFFGAKSSIYGTPPPLRWEDFKDDAFYQNNDPDLLAKTLQLLSPEALRRQFPQLFVLPWEAAACPEWAAFQLGMQCRKEPDELKRLLGWRRVNSPRSVAASLVRTTVRKSIRLAQWIRNPDDYAKTVSLSKLEQANPGETVRTRAPLPDLISRNGPRLAWELEHYYYGLLCRVQINPPDGPAVDLAPGEGVSPLALAKHHPLRKVYYLEVAGEQTEQLHQNLRISSEAGGRIVPLQHSSRLETLASWSNPYEQSNWQALRNEFKSIFSDATLLKIAVETTCWQEAVAVMQDFPRCRLLLLECSDKPQGYLGPLLARLRNLHFIPRLDRLTSQSFQEPGFLARRSVLSLALTRSGLVTTNPGSFA